MKSKSANLYLILNANSKTIVNYFRGTLLLFLFLLLSNLNSQAQCDAAGGDLTGGPFVFDEVGDGNPDMIPAGSITLANSQGDNSIWVVTHLGSNPSG